MLSSLQRANSLPHIVHGLSEASQPYFEYSSYPFGYTDPQAAYKRIQCCKKVKILI